ncbi:wax ester/triacylglycerol synthase family O-acyltransferase [Mycobacterium sp. Z3061]|uniref:wax ester/triacylglycerol synthase family O-acyltransferase n=1 Tax=Mycobacterium sp. Z3061 TaxID=3073562 RepID=UPI0028772B17|nr:wax ester/triacylglycerol synthase family O-acyltransferase [Mycobacterium sp. Z3061]
MDLLSPLDTAMMAAELLASPMHVGVVLILSPPPDAGPGYVDDVYASALVGVQPIDRRLRRYPHRGVDTGGMWVWRELESVDLEHHCQRRTLSVDAGGLWELIGELDAERLDRSRPMWMSYLIDGLEDGRFAFYVKVHHTVIDGVAGLRMITDALSADPAEHAMPPFYADRWTGPPPDTSSGLVSRLTAPLRWVGGTVGSGVGLVEAVVTGMLATVVDSLVAHVTKLPFDAPYTRFNGRLGAGRAVCAGSWPRHRIQAIQQLAGVSANDVITAMLAGVVRQWLREHEELPDRSLVAVCPITVRSHAGRSSKQSSGNMFGLWLCPLGTDLDDPGARLGLIHRSMAAGKRWVAKRGSAASLLTNAGSVAATVIPPLLPVTWQGRTGYNLPISHVPGPRTEMYFNGAHVEEIYPVSTVYDGQGLNVTTCSYADRVGFGFVAGADVVPDIERFIPLTEACLAELEVAVGACPG